MAARSSSICFLAPTFVDWRTRDSARSSRSLYLRLARQSSSRAGPRPTAAALMGVASLVDVRDSSAIRSSAARTDLGDPFGPTPFPSSIFVDVEVRRTTPDDGTAVVTPAATSGTRLAEFPSALELGFEPGVDAAWKTVYRTGGVGGEDAPGEDERGDGEPHDLRLGTFEEILRGRGGGGGGGGGGGRGGQKLASSLGRGSVTLGASSRASRRRRHPARRRLRGGRSLSSSFGSTWTVGLSDGPESAPTSASSPPIAKSRSRFGVSSAARNPIPVVGSPLIPPTSDRSRRR